MRRIKRLFVIPMVAALACSMLSGCGRSAGVAAETPTSVPTPVQASSPANVSELAESVAEALGQVTYMESETKISLAAFMGIGDILDFGEEPGATEPGAGNEGAAGAEGTAGAEANGAGAVGTGDTEAAGAEASGVEMAANVHMTIQASANPEVSHAVGTVDVNVFGEAYSEAVESYAVNENDSYVVYMKNSGDTWVRSENEVKKEQDQFNLSIFDAVIAGKLRAELAAETVEMNGKNAYQIDIELIGDEIMEYIGNTFDELSSIFGDHYGEAMADAVLPIAFYIDTDTNLPIRMEFDATALGEQIMSYVHSYISITVSEFKVSSDYRGYNEIPAVTVPGDVTAKAVPYDAVTGFPDKNEDMSDV